MGFRVLSLIWVFSDSFFIHSKPDFRIKSRKMSFILIACQLGYKWGEWSNFQYNLHLRRGISSKEENGVGLVVSDEEEEWTVSSELTSFWAAQRHCKEPRGTTCLSALFIDFHNCLLDGLGHNQATFHRDSWQISFSPVKNIHYSHLLESVIENITFLHLELGQVHLHSQWLHRRRAGPFCQFFVGEGAFKL